MPSIVRKPSHRLKKIKARFYQSPAGREPVKDWLKAMSEEDRRIIGRDIAAAEYGWPLGLPTCRPLGEGLFEIRSSLTGNRIGRVLFSAEDGILVLLHGFVKKTQKTPAEELELARKRRRFLKNEPAGKQEKSSRRFAD